MRSPSHDWRHDPRLPAGLAVLLVGLVFALGHDAPLVEDGLFWWVPKGLLAAQRGPALTYAGALPDVMAQGLTTASTPPQWADGLPDYAHPPLYYWWLGGALKLFGPTLLAVRLACLPLGIAAALGMVALAHRLGNAWAGVIPWALPPLLAQLLRPELDLALLAAIPWALLALVNRHWTVFAVLSALATASKEPGVLLVVPAVVVCVQDRQVRVAALTPLLTLGAWGLAHGGLASAERLPSSFQDWLMQDVPAALSLVFVHQWRWLLVVGIGALGLRLRRPVLLPVVALLVAWVLFFSAVGFRLQPHNPDPLTHVRYFGPALMCLAILGGLRWPWLALAGLLSVHARSPFGPEASLHGIHAARAEAAAAPWIHEQAQQGARVWVGAYQGAALGQAWAGQADPPLKGLLLYHPQASQDDLEIGDVVIVAAEGEPTGAFLRGVGLDGLRTWTAHDAVVSAHRVVSRPE